VTIVSSGQRNGFNCVSRRADLGKCAIKLLLVVGHDCFCRLIAIHLLRRACEGLCYFAPSICSSPPSLLDRQRCLSTGWNLCRSNPEGRKAKRTAGSAVDKVRAGDQYQDRQGAGPRSTGKAARPRRGGAGGLHFSNMEVVNKLWWARRPFASALHCSGAESFDPDNYTALQEKFRDWRLNNATSNTG